MRTKTYTDDELLDALHVLAADLGHPPTDPETNDCEKTPGTDTVVRHFGAWNDALAEA